MCNKERLLQMYRYAVSNAMCSNKKEFAKLLGITSQNLSNALSENFHERFCTKGLLLKANNALGNAFSADWVTNGTGEMYASAPVPAPAEQVVAEAVVEVSADAARVRELQYVVDAQKKAISAFEKVVAAQEREIESLKEQLRKSGTRSLEKMKSVSSL